MATYEGARQFLLKESGDGVSLYHHLANVLLQVRHLIFCVFNFMEEQTMIDLVIRVRLEYLLLRSAALAGSASKS